MTKPSRLLAAAAIGAAFVFSSCAYDPYYSYAGGYSSYGYGDGYGYGGSNFSTSLFVTTGDSRWGYDPYCHSYYDYRSRRYYDPYLYGYYPVGYRPRAVYGVPHPHGWSSGRGYCPPPKTIRNVTVSNYRDRESAYRSSEYSWAKQVRSQPQRVSQPRHNGLSNSQGYNQGSSYSRQSPSAPRSSSSSNRSSAYPSGSYSSGSRQSTSGGNRGSGRGSYNQPRTSQPDSRQKDSARPSSYYNTPVSSGAPTRVQSSSGSRSTYTPSPSSQRSSQPSSSSRGSSQGNGKSNSSSNKEPQTKGPRHRG